MSGMTAWKIDGPRLTKHTPLKNTMIPFEFVAWGAAELEPRIDLSAKAV